MADKKVKTALNLRRKPTVKSAVLTVIPSGTVITVPDDGKDGAWLATEYKDLKGFVMSKYLEEV